MTAQEIENLIDIESSNYSELDNLQSNSSTVAFWQYAKKVIVFVTMLVLKMFDQHKKDINELIDQTETGSIDWYLDIVLKYQHGDSLIIENNRPVYPVVNAQNQIIKRVACKESFSGTGYKLIFKIVKEVAGEYAPLNITELNSVTVYISRRKIPGTWIEVQSLPADVLYLDCDIILDALLFDSNGNSISDPSIAPIDVAIKEHLKVFDFGGILYLSELIAKVKAVPGVKDFYLNTSKINNVLFIRSVESNAGYIKLDPTSTYNYVLS